jgi:hypothetical protein
MHPRMKEEFYLDKMIADTLIETPFSEHVTDTCETDNPNASRPNASRPNASHPNASRPNASRPNASHPISPHITDTQYELSRMVDAPRHPHYRLTCSRPLQSHHKQTPPIPPPADPSNPA